LKERSKSYKTYANDYNGKKYEDINPRIHHIHTIPKNYRNKIDQKQEFIDECKKKI